MTSLSKNARVAGLLYVLASVVGVLRLLYIPSVLIVHGDATATAANLVAHESLFRLGIVSSLIAATLWLFVPLALYRLLKGVDKELAVLMVILGSFMQVPLFFVSSATDVGALQLARDGNATFATLFLNLHHHLELAGLIFGGLWLLPFGLLVYRSRFLPRLLGIWLMVGCFGWLAFSVAGFLFPESEDRVFTLIQPITLGEVATMLWLVIMGAKEQPIAAAKS